MNKTDDSHTPDVTRFINQRNEIILKEFIGKKKKNTKALFQKKPSPSMPGSNSSSFLVGKTSSGLEVQQQNDSKDVGGPGFNVQHWGRPFTPVKGWCPQTEIQPSAGPLSSLTCQLPGWQPQYAQLCWEPPVFASRVDLTLAVSTWACSKCVHFSAHQPLWAF